MSQFHPNITPSSLRDKVILITGGANGIGASLVQLCCEKGAYVCFGDVATESGEKLARECCSNSTGQDKETSNPPRAVFQHTNVADYSSVLALFDTALNTYGRIDHAIAAAGIGETGDWFDPALDMESIREAPSTKTLDVNLLGCLYFSRIALVYLRQNRPENTDRSILLFSSVAGFKESPGIFVYQASKHGILGLMRSLRLFISKPNTHNIRINAVCPWMTMTYLVRGIKESWFAAGLPANTPLDVAKVAAGMVCDSGMNGKSMYVEGGRAWEIEDNLDRLEPQWLGEEPSRSLAKGQEVLGDGTEWSR